LLDQQTVIRTFRVDVYPYHAGLPMGTNDLRAFFSYVKPPQRLALGAGQRLIEEWDLDLEEDRKRSNLFAIERRKAPKLVHRAIFSMPAGTPPKKVLAAVHDFAREEFGRKHRYAMVLHTDEPHPHVHLVRKAVSEEGVRLNINRTTLQHWRREYARQCDTFESSPSSTAIH
jgi:hypothetical protein